MHLLHFCLLIFPLLEGGCRERFTHKEKLFHPFLNFMGRVDMYKSDIKHEGQGQSSVNSDITKENLHENLLPGRGGDEVPENSV